MNNPIGCICPNADALLARFRVERGCAIPTSAQVAEQQRLDAKAAGVALLDDVNPEYDTSPVNQQMIEGNVNAVPQSGIGAFRATAGNHPNDLALFGRVGLESTKLGTPPVPYRTLRVDDTHVDGIWGDSGNPVYNPPVQLYMNYLPANIVLELLQFGLSATNDDLNCMVNAKHFLEMTNQQFPSLGDKFLDSRGKTYKLTKVVKDMDNIMFGPSLNFGLVAKQSEEEF